MALTKEERIAELQTHWRKAETAAKAIAYQKPENQSWDEAAIAIANLEFSTELELGTSTQSDDEDYAPKGIYPTAWYIASGIEVCSKCGERLLRDENDSPMCAEGLAIADCPVLTPPKSAEEFDDFEGGDL
jgi:hypothetical protein